MVNNYEQMYYKLLEDVADVVRARNAGDFSPILPKLKAIVNEGSDEPVFPAA